MDEGLEDSGGRPGSVNARLQLQVRQHGGEGIMALEECLVYTRTNSAGYCCSWRTSPPLMARRGLLLGAVLLGVDGSAVTWPSSCAGQSGAPSGCTCTDSGTTFDVPASTDTIPPNAFTGCASLQSITGMAGITSIGQYAFTDTGLISFAWPGGAATIATGTFYKCALLTSIAGTEAVTSVGHRAFGNSGLVSFEWPVGATTVPDSAFKDCSALTAITGMEAVTSLGTYAFGGTGLTSFAWPAGAAVVPSHCFRSVASLTSITGMQAVTSIGSYSFFGTGLTSFAWPASATVVTEGSFMRSTSLTSLTGMDAVASVAGYAFYGCTSLLHVYLPADCTAGTEAFTDTGGYTAGEHAFYGSHAPSPLPPPPCASGVALSGGGLRRVTAVGSSLARRRYRAAAGRRLSHFVVPFCVYRALRQSVMVSGMTLLHPSSTRMGASHPVHSEILDGLII